MSMLRYIGLLLLIPLLDAILLVFLVAGPLSFPLVVLLVVLTALVGMLLARFEGRHTVRKIQTKLAQGDPPTDELIDGGLLLVAGAFLLTPGLLTDLLGFLIVIPLTRYPIRAGLKRWVIVPYVDTKTNGFATGQIYLGGFPGGGTEPGADPDDTDTTDFDVDDISDVDYEDLDEN